MFNKLIEKNCFSKNGLMKKIASNLLEKLYGCEVNCTEIDKRVLFAHHGRGCTIVAAKIYENVAIFQNVTIGSNMKYNKENKEWENVGNPIICKNVVIADGAKILGPVTIGDNSFIAAGSIITKDVPTNTIAYGVNKMKPKDSNYDFTFNSDMINPEEIIKRNYELIAKLEENN